MASELTAPRARAFAALGGLELLEAHPNHDLATLLVRQSAEQLMSLSQQNARDDWDWFEPSLAYDNARLPEALIRASSALGEPEMLTRGLSAFEWLIRRQTSPRGSFRPVGCNSFGRPYAPPLAFDQQPLEATATIDAAGAAYRADRDEKWRHVAHSAFGWFFGDNDAGVPLANVSEGSCFDGLMATGINRNMGAESILALHLAAQTMRETFGKSKQAGQERLSTSEAREFAAT